MDIEKDNHSPNYKDKSDNHPDLNMEPPYQTENYKEQAQPNPNGNCIKQSDEFEGIQITGSLKVDKNDSMSSFDSIVSIVLQKKRRRSKDNNSKEEDDLL